MLRATGISGSDRTRRAGDGASSQRVGNFSHLPTLIRHFGVDPSAVMRSAGLAPDALDDAEGRISYSGLGRVLHAAVDSTGCGHLGLLLGRMWHLADVCVLGELVRNSPTVGSALRALAAWQHLNSEGGLAFLFERGPVVDLIYAIYQPHFKAPDVLYDVMAAAAINYMRDLCGPDWQPSEIFLPHAKPTELAHYRNLLKLQPRFDSENFALRFPSSWLTHPVAGADSERFRKAREEAERVSRPDLLQQVRRAVRGELLEAHHSGDDVAQTLAMHRRTLNRRLKAEGTTFQRVLDSVRYSVACELLSVSEVSLDNVAAALGYAAVSPFMRAFSRWSGTTPGQWRRRVGPASGDAGSFA